MHRGGAATIACEDAGYLMALFRRLHLLTWRCQVARHSICECFGISTTEVLCCGSKLLVQGWSRSTRTSSFDVCLVAEAAGTQSAEILC